MKAKDAIKILENLPPETDCVLEVLHWNNLTENTDLGLTIDQAKEVQRMVAEKYDLDDLIPGIVYERAISTVKEGD